MDHPGDAAACAVAFPDGLFEGVQRQVAAKRPGCLPAHDAAAVGVGDEGHIHESRPGPHVGDVRDPQPVRGGRREPALDKVPRPLSCCVGDGGAPRLAPRHAAKAQVAHQTLHGAASHGVALAVELGPHLGRPIDPEVLRVHPSDLDFEGVISLRARRRRTSLGGPVRPTGANCSALQIGSTPKRSRWVSM